MSLRLMAVGAVDLAVATVIGRSYSDFNVSSSDLSEELESVLQCRLDPSIVASVASTASVRGLLLLASTMPLGVGQRTSPQLGGFIDLVLQVSLRPYN